MNIINDDNMHYIGNDDAYVVNDNETILYTNNLNDNIGISIVVTTGENIVYRFLINININDIEQIDYQLGFVTQIFDLIKNITQVSIVSCSKHDSRIDLASLFKDRLGVYSIKDNNISVDNYESDTISVDSNGIVKHDKYQKDK